MSIKKTFAALLAAALLSGCGAQTGSPPAPSAGARDPVAIDDNADEETVYFEEVRAYFKEYSDASKAVQTELTGKTYDSSKYDPAEAALDKLEKMTPPGSYKELHSKLCDSIKTEREMIAAMREVMDIAKNEGDKSPSLKGKTDKANELMDKSTFPAAIMDIVKKYKENHEITTPKGSK